MSANISQVFQNYNDKIMMTTPQSSTPRDTSTKPLTGGTKIMFSSQAIGTIPRYSRDPKFFLVKFEKRRVKTLHQDALPEQ